MLNAFFPIFSAQSRLKIYPSIIVCHYPEPNRTDTREKAIIYDNLSLHLINPRFFFLATKPRSNKLLDLRRLLSRTSHCRWNYTSSGHLPSLFYIVVVLFETYLTPITMWFWVTVFFAFSEILDNGIILRIMKSPYRPYIILYIVVDVEC